MSTPEFHSQTGGEGGSAPWVEMAQKGDIVADNQVDLAGAASECVEDWKRIVYLGMAGVFFLAGVLGALLPLLPATPFLLLASFFLSKSSPRLNRALLGSRIFGSILRDWHEHGGIRGSVRIKAVAAVVLVVSVTLFVSELSRAAMISLVFLALVGILVVLKLPSATGAGAEHETD
jgi:uncharacterized membrane protein YbaN (DUF454 family)